MIDVPVPVKDALRDGRLKKNYRFVLGEEEWHEVGSFETIGWYSPSTSYGDDKKYTIRDAKTYRFVVDDADHDTYALYIYKGSDPNWRTVEATSRNTWDITLINEAYAYVEVKSSSGNYYSPVSVQNFFAYTIDNNNLVSESVSIDERMCSGDTLKFGLCEGSSLEFQYFDFPNITGQRIQAFVDVESEEMEYSKIYELKRSLYSLPADGRYKITATAENMANIFALFFVHGTTTTRMEFTVAQDGHGEIEIPNAKRNDDIYLSYRSGTTPTAEVFQWVHKWHTIPMGFFDVKKCSRQASTGIIKVTAYNKLQSEYLDAKANDLIIEAVEEGEYGNQNGVSIDAILYRDLKNYAVETDYEEVGVTYPTHDEIFNRWGKVSISGREGNYSGDSPWTNVLYVKNGDQYERYGDLTYGLWSVDVSIKIKITNYSPIDYYRLKVNCKRLVELFKTYSSDYHDFYVPQNTGLVNPPKEPFLTYWMYDSLTPTHGVRASLSYNNNGTYDIISVNVISNETDDAHRTDYVLNPRVIISGVAQDEIRLSIMLAWRFDKLYNTSAQRYYNASEILGPHMSDYCALIEEFLNTVKNENLIICERRKSSQLGNLTMSLETAKSLPDVTLRELQSSVFESICQFGQLDRVTDLFSGVELNHSRLYPADNLYPADTLYPDGAAASATKSMYSKLWADEGNIHKWRYLIITYKGLNSDNQEEDFTLQRTVNADGTDDYNMSDNWLFRNLIWTAADVGDYADAMVAKMQDITWFPFEMWCAGLPYLETGDEIEIPLGEHSYTSYILQRQLKGIQNLQDTYINGTLDIF